MTQKKKWSASAKLKIALEAYKNETTITDICQRYQVAPSQVHAWKKQLLEEGAQMFDKTTKKLQKKTAERDEQTQRQLYEKIGELTVERDFLKKNWEKFQEKIDDN